MSESRPPPPLPPPPPPPPTARNRTSASKGEKIAITVLFVLIGLPPGLCSLFGTLFLLHDPSAGPGYVIVFGVPVLIGFAIFGSLLWLLMRTWRRSPP